MFKRKSVITVYRNGIRFDLSYMNIKIGSNTIDNLRYSFIYRNGFTRKYYENFIIQGLESIIDKLGIELREVVWLTSLDINGMQSSFVDYTEISYHEGV